jgi:hypothetical protein
VAKSLIETDVRSFPLMCVRMPNATLSDEDVRTFVIEQRNVLLRRERHAVLADATHARAVTPLQRKLLAEWLEEAEPLNRAYTVCIAVVINNALIRGAMTAVLWLKTPASPTKVFGTVEEAATWVLAELRRAGVANLGPVEAYVASLDAPRRAAR